MGSLGGCGLFGIEAQPDETDDDGSENRTDHTAGPKSQPITGEETRQQATDERTGQAGSKGHPPIDAGRGPTQKHLGKRSNDHSEQDDSKYQHSSTLGPVETRRAPENMVGSYHRQYRHSISSVRPWQHSC